MWHDEEEVHGAVHLDGKLHATVTVMPAVTAVNGPIREEGSGVKLLKLRGTGFNKDDTAANVVTLGGNACAVRNVTRSTLVCELREAAAPEQKNKRGAWWPDPRRAGGSEEEAHGGPGLVLLETQLRDDVDECATSLEAAQDSYRCVDTNSSNVTVVTVPLRQQLVFPHHTVERHSIETDTHLHERPHGHVLLTTNSWLVPPVDGLYTFQAELSSAAKSGGGVGHKHMPCLLTINTATTQGDDEKASGCKSGPLRLIAGRRYAFNLAAVISGFEQLVVRATVVMTDDNSIIDRADQHSDRAVHFAAAPAEWFEARPSCLQQLKVVPSSRSWWMDTAPIAALQTAASTTTSPQRRSLEDRPLRAK